MKNLRFWSVALLLAAVAILLNLHAHHEVIPFSEPLADMPRLIDGRYSTDVPMDQETLDVLGAGDFMSRVYDEPGKAPIGLFIGYFPTQRTGVTIHSPKHCLPGAG